MKILQYKWNILQHKRKVSNTNVKLYTNGNYIQYKRKKEYTYQLYNAHKIIGYKWKNININENFKKVQMKKIEYCNVWHDQDTVRFSFIKCWITEKDYFIFPGIPNNGYKSGWSLSMKQCKESRPSHYLLGNVNLTYPHLTCSFVSYQSHVVWIGVRRQIYTSINLGMSYFIFDRFV